MGGGGFDEAGGDGVDADAARPEFIGQRLAVAGQGGLRRGVGDGRFIQGQAALDRGDVHDGADAPRHHRRQECAVDPHRAHQVELERLVPHGIGQGQRAPTRRRRSADVIDQQVEVTELALDSVHQAAHAVDAGQVSLHVAHRRHRILRQLARRGDHGGAARGQRTHDGLAHALGAAGDQRPLVFEGVVVDGVAHGLTSREAMLSDCSAKWKASAIGLPGKLPLTSARKA